MHFATKKSACCENCDSGMINENNMSSFPHPQVHAEETQFPGVSFCQSLMEDSMMTSGNADFTEYRHMIYVESHVKSQNNKKTINMLVEEQNNY